MARDNRAVSRAAMVLAFVAALLAFTAAAIRYAKDGEVDFTPILGGLFMLALGLGFRTRLKEPPPGDGGPSGPGT